MLKLADLTCEGYGTNYPLVGVAFATPAGVDVSVDLDYVEGKHIYHIPDELDNAALREKLRLALALFIDTALRFGSADELTEDFQEYEAPEIDNKVDNV